MTNGLICTIGAGFLSKRMKQMIRLFDAFEPLLMLELPL